MAIHKKIGVLGAGQLGKMLCQAASDWDLDIHVMDKAKSFPAANLAKSFQQGDFSSYGQVLKFGKLHDIVTIEIEHVNLAALRELSAAGIEVYPNPSLLHLVIDKGFQKTYYRMKGFPTSEFILVGGKLEIKELLQEGELKYPFVQKLRRGGYDGRGVSVIKSDGDKFLPGATVLEPLVDIEKELSVIVARRQGGECVTFPPVEMVFHPEANLVEFLLCPARIEVQVANQAKEIAHQLALEMDLVGIMAIEMFLTTGGKLLINEVAPRPHNSGHHTIEANITSQYQQHLRAILDMPLGSTRIIKPSAMVNLLGEEGAEGEPVYRGFEELLSTEGVYPHIYGKSKTRPWRKMGHITILGDTLEEAIEKAERLKDKIAVQAM